jgi:Uma2 family endonuclease
MDKHKSAVQPNKVKEQSEVYNEAAFYDDHPFIEVRYEIIDGIRYDFQPSPTFNHQRLVTELAFSLSLTCHSTGTIIVAPMDVYFNEDNTFQPDVIYISLNNAKIIKPNRIEGAPDLVIEILSPSTSINDKINKKVNYERFGVLEYWIVDPVHLFVDQFILDAGKFLLHGTYAARNLLTSPRFSCININLEKLFSTLIQE